MNLEDFLKLNERYQLLKKELQMNNQFLCCMGQSKDTLFLARRIHIRNKDIIEEINEISTVIRRDRMNKIFNKFILNGEWDD